MGSIRCLLVDDCEEFKDFLLVFLAQHLPKVEIIGIVDDAATSIALAARLKPDLILMDLGQGEMNGLEATRLLKGLPGACRVVLLSGNAGSAYYDAATAAGADSFISKTDIYEHLVPLIQQMFR